MNCRGGIGGTYPMHNVRKMVRVTREGNVEIHRCPVCGSMRERWR
jgi:hypothetical protein